MHYLVTGGAGFIGSHLVEALINRGHTVRVVDNLFNGKREYVSAQAEFCEVDIRNLDGVRNAVKGIEGIFHVAALPRIGPSIQNPVLSAETNIMGTLNVLVAAKEANVRRVVFSASSSAYGKQDTLPLHPDMVPRPLNPYALQKYVGELLCRQHAELYGLSTVSLRYFNVYGSRMTPEGPYATVLPIWIAQCLRGEALTITGTGEQSRDFTHVADVVEANILAMESNTVGQGEVLNVGAGEPQTMNAIARLFPCQTAYIPGKPGEAAHTMADISRTTELLGWRPRVRFVDGVRDLLNEWGIGSVIS
jgi:nucleoside-diphosphate-sugar epimerase